MTSLKPYILRYWESEFPDLRPSKNRAGKRIYRSNEVDLILLIKKLLYEEKYTIEGARNKLKNSDKRGEVGGEKRRQNLLEEIKTDLREVIYLLEENRR